MIGLIANENMKIYQRPHTWALIVPQLVVIILPLFFIQPGSSSDNWRQTLIEDNRNREQALKDAPFLDDASTKEITEAIQVNHQYRLDHDIAPMASMWSVVSEWMFVIQTATLFEVIIASDIVASEFGWGTIKLLLIRPVSRMKILMSKYAAVLIFAALMLAVSFLASCLIGGMAHGFGGAGDVHLYVQNGVVQESSMALHVFGTYLLKSVNLLMIATLAYMLSAVFRSSSLAIAVSMLCLFAGAGVTMLLSKYGWAKFILFANTDLTPYLDGNAPIPGMTLGFSAAVLPSII
jgi:ABC-2 type transport system permease protein